MSINDKEKAGVAHIDDVRRRASLVANINQNTSAKIQNPLFGIPKQELFAQVDAFCAKEGFDDVALFRKGALVGQNASKFETYEELSEDDKYWLRRETTHKWSQPRALIMTVVIASIGAAVQGWDQTGSNGANLSFPTEFGISDDHSNPHWRTNGWKVGLVNAAPYIASALLGCWLVDPLNNWVGRRGTIFIAGIICLVTPIGSAFTRSWQQLMAVRLIMGIGMGLKSSTVPIFTAENSPSSVRGGLVMSWQMWTAFGIFLGFAANLAVFRIGKLAWRLQLGSAFIPAVPLVLGVYLCPESPRWLMKKKRYHQAFKSYLRLRNSPLQAARDMYYVHCQLEEESLAIKESNYVSRFVELFTVPRLRRATLAGFVVMIAQQWCGINIIAFYSSSVFAAAGYNQLQCLLASFGFGALNFVFAIPAVFVMDTFGRRSLLLSTFPNMAWTLLATGLCFLIPDGNAAKLPCIMLFIYIFAIFYSVGEGPVPFVVASEVFPLTHREMGMGFSVSTTFFWASVLGLTWPPMERAMKPTGAFCFYAGLNCCAFLLIFLFVPETKQLTLEELDYVFGVPTSKHAGYQIKVWLPWFVRRYVLFNKSAKLPPLYDLDEVGGIEKDPEYTSLAVSAAH